ncbi:MAG: Ribonuclease HII [Thermovirga lienii]|jgi:ribonuclease HII|nr:MAG: Ribonuclease HII [Thermovirga lienii]
MKVVGVDEAGRGPLAGPVVAAAVYLENWQTRELLSLGLNDSKKLSPKRREALFEAVLNMGVCWRAQAASPARIDKYNILNATLWAMKRAVVQLPLKPDLVVIDGNMPIGLDLCTEKPIVGADSKVPSVAVASIIAKVLRDRAMVRFSRMFPQYGFERHKGYPTKEHYAVLRELGPCKLHRKSFRLL